MTAPTDYARQGDFTDDENTNKGGRVTQDSAQLDAEFDDIERVISEITTNLNLIQRADTLINAGVVPYSALTGECISAISALNGSNVWVLRGAWSASGTDYNVNDVATNGGESFLSITDHTSGATVPADDATNWLKLSQKGTDGTAFTWQGSWVVDTNFYVNDVVEESGSTYICITDHTSDSSTFATDAAYWELMASQGTDGTSTLPTESGSSDERVLISKGAPSSRVWGYVTTTQAPTLAPLAA
ncbi:MAG: hypothetical protein OEY17_04340, partial [Nitrosopumilus sp.]|nr:hypothetical protein [Nitrosopumilus sp.]